MVYRRVSLATNTQHHASANSHIYPSFAGPGPSRQTDGTVFDTPVTMWWDEERIDSTVNRQFVLSKLRPDEQARLDQPLGFGDGLTDDTYMEWIEMKAKRIFLILVDLGVPDQIFGVIDDSWDDDDLPVPFDQVERLQLTYDKDEKLEKKFFHRQFLYLLRNVQKGEHLYYDDEEVVPLEFTEKVGAVASLTQSNIDKVHLPGRPDDVFVRRRIPLGTTPGRMPKEEFLSGVEAMRAVEHDHLTSLWASYVHQGSGYLLLTPVNESSLKSFLNVTPQSIKILAKQDRRILVLNWIHCLADAVSFLHKKGLSHRHIKPSNVLLDVDNNIFLSDSSIFGTEKPGFDKETYDYQAPEQAPRPASTAPVSRPSTARRTTSQGNSFGFSAAQQTFLASNDPSSMYISSTGTGPTPSTGSSVPNVYPSGKHDPQKADIFSLGTIFLEIMTFLLKRTSRTFASHRSSKNKTAGRGGGLPDSSFHKNPRQVDSWMSILAKDGKKKEDRIFRSVSHILALIEKMLNPTPDERPSAYNVQEKLYCILIEFCGLGPSPQSRGRIHCTIREEESNDWNFGFDKLRLASQRAAAEACASVNPAFMHGGPSGSVSYGLEWTPSVVSSVAWGPGPSPPTSPVSPIRDRTLARDGDIMSVSSGNKSVTGRSSDGKSRSGSASLGSGIQNGKPKPKAKAWQAPVYAEMSFG
ncbi:hypothetical protein ONS95_005629 [Cadophora gregata]|uniref:uncharacterized protein n=1 Tax=Cadophora gregata TaxID=51156 RepID=UPI0026DBF056|nr:uncharacterized protein ONS95_005629 [Cadophora gregata]KAK0103617.1 hypothetical protein ONS95_005629 [Cadophora gregata]KAK0107811.1 hypothetical protein ONS96_003601 [Cadophora gregata f. sp. sojae]